jgi:hypothetical protein
MLRGPRLVGERPDVRVRPDLADTEVCRALTDGAPGRAEE